ncbi:MAG: hypothetical protein L0271_27120 [Gemmatimonadetes bacterium]|nr:hypothetical protein [Gemmatimonadota bacterium]
MTRKRTSLVRSTMAALVAVTTAAVPVSAQDLPDAKSLLDRHIQATGAGAFLSVAGMRTTGTFALPSMGASGNLEMIQARPNLMLMTVNIAGLGEIRSGFDGTNGWSLNPMEGPRILTGKELAQLRDDADFAASLRDASLVASMETVEKTQAAGRDCFKVRMTWKSGRETFDCFDAENGLLIATWQTAETAMGPVDATLIYTDYREFGGVRIPTRTTQQVMGQEFVITVDSVDFAAIDSARFKVPAEIEALIRK